MRKKENLSNYKIFLSQTFLLFEQFSNTINLKRLKNNLQLPQPVFFYSENLTQSCGHSYKSKNDLITYCHAAKLARGHSYN